MVAGVDDAGAAQNCFGVSAVTIAGPSTTCWGCTRERPPSVSAPGGRSKKRKKSFGKLLISSQKFKLYFLAPVNIEFT